MILARLFYEFFLTGLFSVGGGLATLPFLYDMAEKTGWFTETDVANMLAVSQSTPGAIGVNMATYVGYTTAGIAGSLTATLALVMPSIIIILTIARFLKSFGESKLVKAAFYGLRAASVGLIGAAGLQVCQMAFIRGGQPVAGGLPYMFNWLTIALAILLFLLMEKYKKHPAFYIALAALIGILFNLG